MSEAATLTESRPSIDEFAAMLDESLGEQSKVEGSVVKGTVIRIENDEAVVDVGLKSEGRIALKEFSTPGNPVELQIGDEVEVYVERFENRGGEA
ncbi:MAG: S1 RNA-binding domain-containing protein, partial [Pseudomonadota bacterium]